MKRYAFTCMMVAFPVLMNIQAGEIGYNERFALSDDHKAALAELIAGTEDYYYYNALSLELDGKLDQAKKMIDEGIRKYNHSSSLRELENRYALKIYSEKPEWSRKYIIDKLNIRFNHRQKKLNPEIRLPSKLDQNLISFDTLAKYAFSEKRHTNRFEDSAFDYLVKSNLTPYQRRSLLSRLRRPDYPGIVNLIIEDLKYKHSRGFGSHQVHNMLTVEQLEECLKLKPDLIKQSNFINVYLTKLRPNDDVNWAADDKEYELYLKRLIKFADRLSAVHNSLKANIMYLQLSYNMKKGVYDKDLFMHYLKMPRPVHYMKNSYLDRKEFYRTKVNLNASFQKYIQLPAIKVDEQLVRYYLMHFLKDAPDFKAYEDYIEYNYLKRLFAETKLVNGIGDQEEWFALMNNPTQVKALRDRIDIELLPTNKDYITIDDDLVIDVAIKNVKDLTVKVFEINTTSYYRQNLSEITTAIELDGLVANATTSKKYKLPPMRRHEEKLSFPEIKKPGIYVVELIGNGVSSRALVRKGRLTLTERIGSAGHVFTVYDEKGNLLPDAVLWMGNREYKAEKGEIHIPFSGKPKREQVVVTNNGFSELKSFQHLGENYKLNASMHLGREQLISGKKCTVTVRPELLINGEPIDVSLLENPILTIRSIDLDGNSSEMQVNDFKLYNDKESNHTFRVPKRLRKINIVLSGKIKNLNSGKYDNLATISNVATNKINETAKIEDIYIRKSKEGYIAELLGRNAEQRKERPINLELKHRDFKQTVHVSLKTDEKGRVNLGELNDIVYIRIEGPEKTQHTWQIPKDKVSRTPILHALAGESLMIPVMDGDDKPINQVVSFLETRGGVFVRDCIKHVSYKGGCLVVKDLEPGDYSLMTKPDGRKTLIRVTEGKEEASQLLGKNRVLERKASDPLQIQKIEVTKDNLIIKVANTIEGTRVHAVMTRFLSDDLFAQFGIPTFRSPTGSMLPRPESNYVSGRIIGDEYRYVMERKNGKIYPGNMLTRPSLILNPWSPRSTNQGKDDLRLGEDYVGKFGGGVGKYSSYGGSGRHGGTGLDQFTSFDFLESVSPETTNLIPDKDGIVKIPIKEFPVGQQIHVYAVNDTNAVYRQTAFKERPEGSQDLRLVRPLDINKDYTERKAADVLRKGEVFKVADILSAKLEIVDSISSAYRLLTALNDNQTFAEFNFILKWPEYSKEKKQELYKKYACHELHLFLSKKDPQFFKETVFPYLKNKKDKTFMDDFLLGNSLDKYLDPWSYNRLNMVERALLARNMKSQQKSTARHLKDLYDLIPVDVDRFNRIFGAALSSSGLEGGPAGLMEAEEMAEKEIMTELPRKAKSLSKNGISPAVMDFKDSDKLALDRASNKPSYSKEKTARRKSDNGKRESLRQLYRKLDKTKEWVENNYYHQLITNQVASLVNIDAFWKDYAKWDGEKGFLSGNLIECGDSFTEMMLALAVLDLPFKAKEHTYDYEKGALNLKVANDLILFHKQISEVSEKTPEEVLLVNQSFFAMNDRYRYVDNEQFDKFVTKAFEIGRVYGCRLVMTNPTSTRRKVDMLLQIPAGSIAVNRGMKTSSRYAVLNPYSTQSQEYYFYFPAEGKFPHYPVHVAQDEKILASAKPFEFNVVTKVDNTDKDSWEHISQFGTEKDVIEYLNTHNINRLNLDMIAWRMKDKDFFKKTLKLLENRKVYNNTLWSYSLYHNDEARIREYLPNTWFADQSGRFIESPLLTVDPIQRHVYEHKEYWPLVNARTFKLGGKRKILNNYFYSQYEAFMKVLTYRPELTDNDKMSVVIYMLLQDRIEEAMKFFKEIKPENLKMKMQYDYMAAYMAFFNEQPKKAEKIAGKYKDYPVDRWRNLFRDVLAQCAEINGSKSSVVDPENRTQTQTNLVDTAPQLQIEIDKGTLKIDHANIKDCTVNYYPMDLELLFSNKPFVQEVGNKFTIIKPSKSTTIKLDGNKTTESQIPDSLKGKNLILEVTSAGITRIKAYYPNALKVDIVENYGQLRVTDKKTGKAIPKVYVKVYAKSKNGSVKFYKDGYTDLRGRFDYTSLNTDEIDSVAKFAILVMSDSNGSVVREATPPKR